MSSPTAVPPVRVQCDNTRGRLTFKSDCLVATFYDNIAKMCEEEAAAGELIMKLPDGRELSATDTCTLAEYGVVHEIDGCLTLSVTVAVRAAELEPEPQPELEP